MLAETVCSAASAAGLGIAAVTAYRRRFRTALRITAYALVPLALVLTGAVEWAARTAFSPVAWAGFGLLGVSWLMLAGSRAVERRRVRKGGPADRSAVAPGASRPAVSGRAEQPAGGSGKRSAPGATGGTDDFDDIEAILKKHGI